MITEHIAKHGQPQTSVRPDVAEAIAQLLQLGEQQSDLQPAVRLQIEVLRTIYTLPVTVYAMSLTTEEVITRWSTGTPLLHNVSLPIDPVQFRALFQHLAAVAYQHERAQCVADLDPLALAHMLLSGDRQALIHQIQASACSPESIITLLRLALLPFLEQVAEQLTPLRTSPDVQRRAPWKHGYCPTCGAWPLLATVHGQEQQRYLHCGMCATTWPAERVWCPFCDTRDHTQLGYLQVEDSPQSIAVCDACHSYLKVHKTLQRLTTPQLLVAEVASIHLDLIALDRGYALPE